MHVTDTQVNNCIKVIYIFYKVSNMKTAFNTGKLPWNTISNSSVKSYTIMQYASIIKENILHTTSQMLLFFKKCPLLNSMGVWGNSLCRWATWVLVIMHRAKRLWLEVTLPYKSNVWKATSLVEVLNGHALCKKNKLGLNHLLLLGTPLVEIVLKVNW